MERIILHVDIDAFFASVEQRDNPSYIGKPVIVGGSGDRGVVSTCSYEARKYGVHSAQPIFKAKKLCPHGIFIEGNHQRYLDVSKQVFEIIHSVCNEVEVVSIDEAYIDITHMDVSVDSIVKSLKQKILMKTGLTISVGISYNKFLAKIGSDWNKPNGIKHITKDMIPNILLPLPIRKIHGLGSKTAEKLNKIGIFTVDDLMKYDAFLLEKYLGKYGHEIYNRINGIDERLVSTTNLESKSIGYEITLDENTNDLNDLKSYIKKFSLKIQNNLNERDIKIKTVTVKIKTQAFENISKRKTLIRSIYSSKEIELIATRLLNELGEGKEIRLVGVSVSNFEDRSTEQLTLFEQF